MKAIFLTSIGVITILSISLTDCNSNYEGPSNHPCHFPDANTENDLRDPFSFKILDSLTFKNIVGVTPDFRIHPDSVKLYDYNGIELDPMPRLRFDNEWIFDNFPPYVNVSFNDPQSLLDLQKKTFYLKVNYYDVDTIEVLFKSCLVEKVLFDKRSTTQPQSIPSSASFYFRK
jgi:hypothetical protein